MVAAVLALEQAAAVTAVAVAAAQAKLNLPRVRREDPPHFFNMGVSKNRGTPKWMVYNGKPY